MIMPQPVEESIKFKILKWILLVSNIVSLFIDLLVIIGGKVLVGWFASVPKDAEDLPIRIFCLIEAIICTIAIVGLLRRNFLVFSVHAALLILYFIASVILTRILVVWFLVFAILLTALTLWFLYELYKLKLRLENPYGV
ncbi:uncharacterized protein LOC128961377 [Oppia nitens]|uniref:uncharacterized protein LOC128961377 n=1 Tax=Oppia nitens TaxID=1686743 RepID=UPI0023DA2B0D|nr:uncharacterized protein LOC128961377 [Oppia nitens]XP_054163585.1 uncharacterized protein LOC128961377 [Oppia nitens]